MNRQFNSRFNQVDAVSIHPMTDYYSASDNFVATLRFDDGSIATLTYTSLGTPESMKEEMITYVDGSIFKLNDYRSLVFFGNKKKGLHQKKEDKGHHEELRILANVIREGGEWPIPLWQQLQATRIALEIQKLI